MRPEFECATTASFLRSGHLLCNISNCTAVIAGIGIFLTHIVAGRLLFGLSLLCWFVASYLGVRVAIDASLFRDMAGEPTGGRELDEFLRVRGLRRVELERPLAERSRAALRLWFLLIVTITVQVVIFAAAIVIHAWVM